MDSGLTYNSNDLQTFDPATRVGINTNIISHTDMPDSVAELYIKANASDSDVPDQEYPAKTIKLGGTIHGSTEADLDSRIDTFKGYFAVRKQNLDINYGSSVRRYTMLKANSLSVVRTDKSLYATFTIDLICKPFGIDTTATDLWTPKTAFSSATFTETPTIEGSAPYQLPVITITINSLTGTGDYVQISNNNNGQELLLYGYSLEAGDVIVIDSVNRVITINDLEVPGYGTFLELTPGANSITYTDGFTTRSVDVEAEYNKRWL
jgi:phage-related protein